MAARDFDGGHQGRVPRRPDAELSLLARPVGTEHPAKRAEFRDQRARDIDGRAAFDTRAQQQGYQLGVRESLRAPFQ